MTDLTAAQQRVLAILDRGPATLSSATDPDVPSVSWRTVRALERHGLAIDVAGIKAIITDRGREVAAELAPAESDHEHGTWRRHRYDGCTCEPCRTAWSVYVARSAMARRRGTQRLVDAAPAVAHVQQLVDEWGVSRHRVWEAGGCSRTMGENLLAGANRKADRDVVASVCAVTVDDLPDDSWMHVGPLHDAVAQIRRWTGMTDLDIERTAGLSHRYLNDSRRKGRTRCTVGAWRAVRRIRDAVEPVGIRTVWLPVEPLEAFLRRPGIDLKTALDDETLRRAWYRATASGRISDVHADRVCVELLSLTLDEVYGPGWDDDEVAA